MANNTTQSKPPIGTIITMPSTGQEFEFKGLQWRNIRNGRIATRSQTRELLINYNRNKKKKRAENKLKTDPNKGQSLITNLDKLKRSTIQRNVKRSSKWFENKILSGKIDKKLLTNKVRIGRLYLYKYIPKHKDTLPIYDIHPMVIPIKYYNDGYLGINLHYLPPQIRIVLLNKLDKYSKGTGEQKRLQLSYQLLKAASNLKEVKPCIKRYLYSHVKSQFARVPPDEQELAAYMPLAVFRDNKGRAINPQQVYKESRNNKW